MVKLFRSEKGKTLLFKSYDRLLSMWNVPFEEKDIATRYGTTHVIVCGSRDNPPLVLFHGVGDNSSLMWFCNASALSNHFCLYAVDTIGGPGKSVPNDNYGKGFEQCLWIDDVLDGLDLKTVNLAGVSNGAYLAQLYTAKRPNKVNRAVCISGGISAGEGGSPIKRMMKVFLPEALFPTEKNILKLLGKLCGENKTIFTENHELMLHWTLLLKNFNNMAMGYHKYLTLNEDECKILSDKTLFIIGDCDPLGSLSSIETFKKYSANYIVVPGAGHAVNHEFSDKINGLIIEFLENDEGNKQL